jgi:hypothetical protein
MLRTHKVSSFAKEMNMQKKETQNEGAKQRI